MGVTYTCAKCRKVLDERKFFTYKDKTKCDMCKSCLTLHVDNYNPDTFLWILEKMDVPWVPEEFNILRDREAAKDPAKAKGGSTIVGKYLAKMRLKNWKGYGWADTERCQQMLAERQAGAKGIIQEQSEEYQEELKAKYEAGEISEAEYKTLVSADVYDADVRDARAAATPQSGLASSFVRAGGGAENFFDESQFIKEDELPDIAAELTKDDKIQMALKWGRFYKPDEWVELEKKYQEMKLSFNITDSDTEGTLLVICKTFLKMNQALDAGDLEGFQKLSRVYETLRKSAKFTAAQNKDEKKTDFSSVGELVAYCEMRGGAIPEYEIKAPLDKVDVIIKDMQEYTLHLINEDPTLAVQIEQYLRKKEILEEAKAKREAEAEAEGMVTDADLNDFEEDIDAQRAADRRTLEKAAEMPEDEADDEEEAEE